VHCENTAIAAWVKQEIVVSGRQDLAAYTESRPVVCEVETIRRMIFLAERTRCPLQIVHTSVERGRISQPKRVPAGSMSPLRPATTT